MTAPVATPSDGEPSEQNPGSAIPTTTPRVDPSQDTALRPLPTTPTRITPDEAGPAPAAAPPPGIGPAIAPPVPRPAPPGAAPPPVATAPAGPAEDSTGDTAAEPREDTRAEEDTPAGEDAASTDADPDRSPDDRDTDLQSGGLPDPAGLNTLGSTLAGPLINSALGVPAAALQGAGMLVPGMAGAVMPTLAGLLDQLGTGPTPTAPASRLSDYPYTVAGPMGELAGSGAGPDAARSESSAAARQLAALKEVEQKLAATLGVSSAKTQAARETLNGIIEDVQTAIESTAVQGNTAEAQAAVITAMRQALDKAGSVVSAAAREKMLDAAFVRQLISDYLLTTADPGPGAGFTALMAARGPAGSPVVTAARRQLGVPYVWGGGGALGPTKGGFDCSGLTQYAVAQASRGRIVLPRTTYEQIRTGRPVPMSALRPGDLVFSNFSAPGVPEHVGIAVGNGQVIHAPQRGQPVQISPLPSGAQARRVM